MKAEGTVAEVLAGAARFAVVCGDAADVLRGIGDGVAAAVVTDPPSGISFMGAEWDRDRGGRAQWVAWLSGILADARRCTRDGGRSVVWSLPRTSHWTGCAVEDAGWCIENTITHLFGTGWPKGKSQLKPAAETWWLARTGRSAELNVEACRVAHQTVNGGNLADNPHLRKHHRHGGVSMFLGESSGDAPVSAAGRYPPNVVLSHAPGCVCVGTRRVATGGSGTPAVTKAGVNFSGDEDKRGSAAHPCHRDPDGTETVEAWECVEGCPVAELDATTEDLRAPGNLGGTPRGSMGHAGGAAGDVMPASRGDSGGASRFFPCFPADPAVFRYVAKPSSAEKSAGSGGNEHMTVKSVALMRWLVDLVTQRGDLVIDPFGGSGTTGVACLASGRRVILVERDPRFAEIARQRCAHWGAEWSAPARASKRRAKRDADEGPQPSLFDRRPEAP